MGNETAGEQLQVAYVQDLFHSFCTFLVNIVEASPLPPAKDTLAGMLFLLTVTLAVKSNNRAVHRATRPRVRSSCSGLHRTHLLEKQLSVPAHYLIVCSI